MAKKKEQEMIDRHLDKVNSIRKRKNQLQRVGLITLIIGIVYTIMGTMMEEEYDIIFPFVIPIFLITFFGSIAMIMGGYYMGMYVEVYEEFIEEKVVPNVLKKIMDHLDEYEQGKTLSEDLIREADMGIDPYYERMIGENYIKGVFHGIPLEMGEFSRQVKEKTGEDGTEEWVSKFNGVMIICRHKFKLTEDICITQYGTFVGPDAVSTESIEFNENFSVKGKDGHSIFLLLTPQLMEEMIKVSNAIGKRLGINFKKDGRLMICISNLGLFESEGANSEEELCKKFEKDMDYIGEILRVLKVPTEAELNALV